MKTKQRKNSLVIVIVIAALSMLLLAGITYQTDKYISGMFTCMCQGLLVLAVFQLNCIKKMQRKSKKLHYIIFSILSFGGLLCAIDSIFFDGELISKIGYFIICLSANALVAHLGDAINDPSVK